MELKRVVVTGLGTLNPLGNDVETTWNNAINGVSGAGPPVAVDDRELVKPMRAALLRPKMNIIFYNNNNKIVILKNEK